MNKSLVKLLSLMLLISLCVTPALADVHPNQMGDQGGARAAEIDQAIRNGTIPPSYNPANDVPVTYGQPVPDAQYNQSGQPVPDASYEGVQTLPGVVDPSVQQPPEAPASSSSPSGGTQALDWFGVGQSLISKNPSITVYDVNTGLSWGAKFINGKNHADIIPASAGDAQKIQSKGITGSYVRRPVVVTIAGTKYAGSMYAVGHGETSYCTYFKGVMCIHFTGSKTHGSNKVDSDHQSAIQSALGSGY